MRRLWVGLLVLPVLTVFFACGSGQSEPATSNASSDTCPVVDPGPPPVCPEGCTWNGEECRKNSGVLILDAHDGGSTKLSPEQVQLHGVLILDSRAGGSTSYTSSP